MFVDRCPGAFRDVLDYLRHGVQRCPLDRKALLRFRRELSFFQYPQLLRFCEPLQWEEQGAPWGVASVRFTPDVPIKVQLGRVI